MTDEIQNYKSYGNDAKRDIYECHKVGVILTCACIIVYNSGHDAVYRMATVSGAHSCCSCFFFENELSGVVFAAFVGMMHDLAMGSLFGFTSIWLMPCCLFVTLFAVNLIHRNILNFLWMNFSALIIVEAAELLFKYVIWRNPDINVVLLDYVLPAMISTVLLSTPIYLLIRLINRKLGAENTTEDILTAFEDAEDSDDNVRY